MERDWSSDQSSTSTDTSCHLLDPSWRQYNDKESECNSRAEAVKQPHVTPTSIIEFSTPSVNVADTQTAGVVRRRQSTAHKLRAASAKASRIQGIGATNENKTLKLDEEDIVVQAHSNDVGKMDSQHHSHRVPMTSSAHHFDDDDDEEVELEPFLLDGNRSSRRTQIPKVSRTQRICVSCLPRRRTLGYLIVLVVLASQAWLWAPSIVGQERLQTWGQDFDDWRAVHMRPPFGSGGVTDDDTFHVGHAAAKGSTPSIDYSRPIATSAAGNPVYPEKMTLPAEYEKPLDRNEEQLHLDQNAFPPQVVSYAYGSNLQPAKAVYKYQEGDPHAGQIPPEQLRILERDIPRLAPVAPPMPLAYPAERWQPHSGWSRSQNGSKSRMEDALNPDKQPREKDWRGYPFNSWTPFSFGDRLSQQAKSKVTMPKVQYAFSAPDRFSGSASDVERDNVLERRRRLVRNAFLHSWEGYKKNAWGHDEVRPVSGTASDSFNGWGATIVDALDTLLVMDLQGEYEYARQHVRDIDFYLIGGSRSAYGGSDGRVPVFETAIRYLGGFLSAYDLSGDTLMLDRAEELAQLLMPAFETSTGVPVGRIKFDTNPSRPSSTSVIFSEAASMLLEMTRLWQVTGNRTYFDRVHRITDWLQYNMTGSPERLGALLPATIFPERGSFYGWYSWGGMIDSAFEYLIKEHQLLGGMVEQYGSFFSDVMDSAHRWLLRGIRTVPETPLLILGHSNGKSFSAKLEHLACFAGGSIGLGAKLLERPHDLDIARRLSESCWWAYNSTTSGIGPEEMTFYLERDPERFESLTLAGGTIRRGRARGSPVVGVKSISADYRGRPETIESVFYMWRITGDPQWQERGWQMFCSWVTHSLSAYGFSSLGNVLNVPVAQTDSMESYVFAETFKYYYLLFSPPSLLSLDDFVFTTEAHPILLPKNGQWSKPGSGPRRFWDENISKTTFGATPQYVGGEQGPIGGLTRMQKKFIYDTWQKELKELEEAKKADEEAKLNALQEEEGMQTQPLQEEKAVNRNEILQQVKRLLADALAEQDTKADVTHEQRVLLSEHSDDDGLWQVSNTQELDVKSFLLASENEPVCMDEDDADFDDDGECRDNSPQ